MPSVVICQNVAFYIHAINYPEFFPVTVHTSHTKYMLIAYKIADTRCGLSFFWAIFLCMHILVVNSSLSRITNNKISSRSHKAHVYNVLHSSGKPIYTGLQILRQTVLTIRIEQITKERRDIWLGAVRFTCILTNFRSHEIQIRRQFSELFHFAHSNILQWIVGFCKTKTFIPFVERIKIWTIL